MVIKTELGEFSIPESLREDLIRIKKEHDIKGEAGWLHAIKYLKEQSTWGLRDCKDIVIKIFNLDL